jgi:hypothetical protein
MNHWFLLSSGARLNPEEGLTLTREELPGIITLDATTEATINSVFAGEVTFPDPITPGIIWEVGGTGQGSKFAIITDGDLILRAGDGATADGVADITKAEAILPAAEVANLAGRSFTLVWEIIINPGRVRLWADGELILENEQPGALDTDRYSGGDDGGWGLTTGSIAGGGVFPWQGTLDSNLRVYLGQIVNA